MPLLNKGTEPIDGTLMFIYVYMYVCMHVCHVWQGCHGSWLFNVNVYTYVCVYVCHCTIGSWLFYDNFYIYVSMSLIDRIVRDHSCGGMIAYVGKWHEEFPCLTRNQLGRVVMTNIWGQYHVDMNWYYMIILCLCLCYGKANAESYISGMKEVWSAACSDKHG